MTAMIWLAVAGAAQPQLTKLVDCRPQLMLMAYETQATERQRRDKPRKAPAPRPCITLASA